MPPLLERPDEFPRWATVPGVDGLSGQPNVVEPPGAKKNSGWHYREKPPRNWQNWLQLKGYEWLTFLAEQKEKLHADYQRNAFESQPSVTLPGGLFVDVGGPVDVWLNGEKFEQSGSSGLAVAASNTNYIYLDSDRVYKVTQNPDVASAATRLLVAIAVTSGVAVTRVERIGRKRAHEDLFVTVGPGDADFDNLRDAIGYAEAVNASATSVNVEVRVIGDVAVTAPISLRRATTIRGTGANTRISWSYTAGPLFRMEDGSGFSIFEDLLLDYAGVSGVDAQHAAIQAFGSVDVDGVSISRCVLNGQIRGVFVGLGAVANRWRLSCNRVIQPSTSALVGFGVSSTGVALDWSIVGNDFQGQTAANSTVAIDLDGAARCIVSQNNIDGYNHGIRLSNDSGDSLVGGNVVNRARTHGIECDAPETTIAGNFLGGCGTDASVQGGSIRLPTTSALRCTIQSNFVDDWKAGFAISCAAGRVVIQGNMITQSTGTATSPVISGGIACQDDYGTIVDNWIDLLVSATLGSGGKRNCYGIKMGLYGSGPSTALTVNGAIRSTVRGNTVRNIGNATVGGVGIDAGTHSQVDENWFENVFGLNLRFDDCTDGAARNNNFYNYGFGPIAAPYAAVGHCIAFDAGSRAIVTGNKSRIPATAGVSPMIFQAGAVQNFVRHNRMQGTTGFQYPGNLHLQDYGTWEQSAQTVGVAVVNAAPALGFPASGTFTVRVLTRGEDAATNDSMGWESFATVVTDGTGAIVGGQFTAGHVTLDNNVGADPGIAMAVVGGLLVMQFTGLIAETWNFHSRFEVDHQIDNYFTL